MRIDPKLRRRAACRQWLVIAIAPLAAVALPGCFAEKSIPMRSATIERLSPADAYAGLTARPWLARAHAQLAHLLPHSSKTSFLTDDLVDADGAPVDVMAHFGREFNQQHMLLHNLSGLEDSAQATGPDASDETPLEPWPGFEDVWAPVGEDYELYGRIGFAERDGQVIDSDCVVILPGLFGDLAIARTRDLAIGLREAGLHVLAIELRGMGRTNQRYPDVYYTFGGAETIDLLSIGAWLQHQPHVRDTGLVGFCYGANHALLTAWMAGSTLEHSSVTPRLREYLKRKTTEPVYRRGVLAFSPTLRSEEIIEQTETEWGLLDNPVLNRLQASIRGRMEQKKHDRISGRLRGVIEAEFSRCGLDWPGAVEDMLRFIRFLDHRGEPSGDKLESARMPVVIVQAANDPLTSAQNVADLFAVTKNPNVAGIVLPGGGHIGFIPYAKSYTYSLIVNFFDAETAPKTATR